MTPRSFGRVGRVLLGDRKVSMAMDMEFAKTAKPQIIPEKGLEVWPEKWGMTTGQFASLLRECQQDPDWDDDFTVGDLVKRYVVPMTRGTGMSYAVMVNADSPKEVDVMVSHAWAENAIDFCRTLERSVGSNEPLFICALSLYQCEDGSGPSIAEQLGTHPQESPFHRVLQKIHDRGKAIEKSGGWWRQRVWLIRIPWLLLLVSLSCTFIPVLVKGCIPMHTQCAYGTCRPAFPSLEFLPVYVWKWTFKPLDNLMFAFVRTGHILGVLTILSFICLEILERSGYLFRGRMVAVPNHNCEMYTRLWCVFEMFVAQALLVPVKLANTLASAGEVNSASAQCSKVEDAQKIDEQIRQYHSGSDEESDSEESSIAGYRMLDDAISEIGNKAWSRALFIEALQAFPLALCMMCAVRLVKKGSTHWWEEQAQNRGDEWYHHVLFWATHGRLGYDFVCQDAFEASPQALWTWLLVFGTLLGYWIVLSTMVSVAKQAQGHLTFCRVIGVASFFIFLEVLLIVGVLLAENLLEVCAHDPHRFHWFMIGFTAALAQGSLMLLLLVLVVALRYAVVGPPAISGRNAEATVKLFLGVIGVTVFIVIMLCTCRVYHPEHYFPSIVVNGALIFGWLVGPLAILWTNAVRYGVRFLPSSTIGRCTHSGDYEVTHGDSDDSESQESEDVKS